MNASEQPLDRAPMDEAATPLPPPSAVVPRPRWAPWFFTALLSALILDQVSKYALFAMPLGAALPRWLDRTVNSGVAWGTFGDFPFAVVGVTLALIPLLGWVWWRHFRLVGAAENLAFGLILGGALGNGWDRLSSPWRPAWNGARGVRDFILVDLNLVGIDYKWPNFNIADASICVGFLLLVVLSSRRPGAVATPGPG